MAFITINGQEFPAPDNVWELITYTNVTSGRNAQGEFIGDRVGRDQYKVNNLQWSSGENVGADVSGIFFLCGDSYNLGSGP